MKNARMRRLIAALLLAVASTAGGAAQTRPNVVLILADDLGYGDPRCLQRRLLEDPDPDPRSIRPPGGCGSPTPTRRQASTPRPATGCSPADNSWRSRLDSEASSLNGYSPALIEPGRLTIASMLKQHGLRDDGHRQVAPRAALGRRGRVRRRIAPPTRRRRRSTGSITAAASPMGRRITASPSSSACRRRWTCATTSTSTATASTSRPRPRIAGAPSNTPAFHRPGRAGASFQPERVLGDLTSRAVRYVRERAAGQQPFFLYLALASPHTPVLPTAAFAGRTGLGPYADFVAETDAAIGQVLQALEQSGAAKNTLVIFASDNGPAPIAGMIESLRAKGHDSAGGWRGAKQDLYEGGHRVPLIVKWPGVVAPGTTSRAVVSLVDVLATHRGHRRPSPAGGCWRRQRQHPPAPAPAGSGVRAERRGRRPIRERVARDSRRAMEALSRAGIGRPQRPGAGFAGRAGAAAGAAVRPRGGPGREDESPGGASGRRPAA